MVRIPFGLRERHRSRPQRKMPTFCLESACLFCCAAGPSFWHARRAGSPQGCDSTLATLHPPPFDGHQAELKEAVEEILPFFKKENVKVYYLSKTSATEGAESFLDKVDAASDEPTPLSWRSDITFKTPAMYIYTSGTTGLPKAAVINHGRIMLACGLFDAGNVTSEDIVYTALPLYHSSALLVGVHGCIMKGATIVLRARFSASQFWDDCRKYNVTVIQYIGEVLRYLCSVPRLLAVIIPSGYEGRTGMACIRLKENCEFNGESTYRHVNTHLPNYARPRFIRIKSAIELTATFKYRKVQLVEEGFNPAVIKDRLYFLDDKENLYVQMTQDIYNSVKKHDFKL
ncbi:PREDICTED: very long-chain acyl-CoA synthetase [Pygoscelis adeliae]|uniref:very long-chain acyl-CoA synthetase n=1 Tax=Pygoscelis adeliae TaxID=9238 RepID=UPI0004F4EC0D|nr:PREDICTED: very long-chain acyl-CoA synthetase [Pygoscelis adeliae]